MHFFPVFSPASFHTDGRLRKAKGNTAQMKYTMYAKRENECEKFHTMHRKRVPAPHKISLIVAGKKKDFYLFGISQSLFTILLLALLSMAYLLKIRRFHPL